MIAVEKYIHYYDAHQNILKDKLKKDMTKEWYSSQHKKNQRVLNQRERELNQDIFLNFDEIQNDLSNIFNNSNLQSTEVDLHGNIILGPKGGEYDASSAAKDLAKVLSNSDKELGIYLVYLDKVLSTIDSIHEKLEMPAISDLILGNSQNPNPKISGFLQANNNKEIFLLQSEESLATLETAYTTLQTAINGLSGFNTEMVSTAAKTEVMQELLSVIKGSLSSIKGILMEGELFAGLCNAAFTGLELIDKEMTGLSSIGKEEKDPKILSDKEILQNALNAISQNKIRKNNPNSDLTLTLGTEGGTAYLGISVKNHHTNFGKIKSENKYDFAQTLSLGSKANLYQQITNVSNQLQKLTGVDPIFYGQQAFGIHTWGRKSVKNAGTASYWEDYLDAVAVLNVLDRLAGEGGYGNFSRFLVVNGIVYSIDDILLSISKNPTQVYGFSVIQYVGRGINKWRDPEEGESDIDAALRRSEEVKSEMIERWQQSTLSTKINLAILNLIHF